MNDKVQTLQGSGWDREVLSATKPVLVDFWAAWCPPCRALAPTIDALAAEYEGRVNVGKLNVDDHPEIASRYGIRSIPSLLLFHDGRVVEQRTGALPISDLRDLLQAHADLAAAV